MAGTAPDYSGSYLCIEEFGGGAYYYAERKAWGGTTFRADGKFIFKVKKEGEKPLFDGSKINTTIYSVQVSEFGRAQGTCYGVGEFGSVVMWDVETMINCKATSEYWVELNSMRYLRAYPYGYLDGVENNDNTPGMFGGTCAKID